MAYGITKGEIDTALYRETSLRTKSGRDSVQELCNTIGISYEEFRKLLNKHDISEAIALAVQKYSPDIKVKQSLSFQNRKIYRDYITKYSKMLGTQCIIDINASDELLIRTAKEIEDKIKEYNYRREEFIRVCKSLSDRVYRCCEICHGKEVPYAYLFPNIPYKTIIVTGIDKVIQKADIKALSSKIRSLETLLREFVYNQERLRKRVNISSLLKMMHISKLDDNTLSYMIEQIDVLYDMLTINDVIFDTGNIRLNTLALLTMLGKDIGNYKLSTVTDIIDANKIVINNIKKHGKGRAVNSTQLVTWSTTILLKTYTTDLNITEIIPATLICKRSYGGNFVYNSFRLFRSVALLKLSTQHKIPENTMELALNNTDWDSSPKEHHEWIYENSGFRYSTFINSLPSYLTTKVKHKLTIFILSLMHDGCIDSFNDIDMQ